MPDRILITGGAGFVGANLAERLLSENNSPHLLIHPQTDVWRLKNIRKDVVLHRCDLGDSLKLRNILKKINPEVVFHLAWAIDPGKHFHAFDNLDSLRDSLNLLQAISRTRCSQILASGTCFEYAPGYSPRKETDVVCNDSLHIAAKNSLHATLVAWGKLTGVKTSWLRLFHVYGPRDVSNRLVPQVMDGVLHKKRIKVTTGEQVRDYLFIDDMTAAMIAVMRAGADGTINIGSGKPVTIKSIVTEIIRQTNSKIGLDIGGIRPRAKDPHRLVADVTILKKTTGWKPAVPLDEGIRKTFEWWCEAKGKRTFPAG